VLAVLISAGLAGGPPARAEKPGPGHDGACRPDIEKHCAGAERGGGATGRCLREHEKDLSPACREQLAAHHAEMKKRADAVYAACKSEVAKHCPGQEPGEGGLIRCLRDHQADLSKECRAALPERRRR
jgi:hypothetical protein